MEQWIALARRDQPVWLPGVRQALTEGEAEAIPLIARLTLCNGEVRDLSFPLPRWHTPEGRRFAGDYLRACVFNAMAALSGRKMTFYLNPGETEAAQLLAELPQVFQVDHAPRTGYGKAVSVANRLSRAAGGPPFSFQFQDIAQYTPAPLPPAPPFGDLTGLLRKKEGQAGGLRCGVDVGGTDIKLALSRDGELLCVKEYDWNPALSPTPQGITGPIRLLVDLMRACALAPLPQALAKDASLETMEAAVAQAGELPLLDGLGISFPDVVIGNRILGGETPKTRGIRDNPDLDYETALAQLSGLADLLAPACRPGVQVRITNDGHMAAFTAAMELAHQGDAPALEGGVIAHSLGTDLGTGWLDGDGTIPALPLELYDFLLDLGSWPSRELDPLDLRSVRNENSGLPGARRYMGQAAAFRLAWQLDPRLLQGFTCREGDHILIQERPQDLRKPCLEHLMNLAAQGEAPAEEIFRRIGLHLAQASRELDFLLHPAPRARYLFGRFVKNPRVFALLREGFDTAAPGLTLEAADDTLARTPLMEQLSRRADATVAQFGQAVGAIYFSAMEEHSHETQ